MAGCTSGNIWWKCWVVVIGGRYNHSIYMFDNSEQDTYNFFTHSMSNLWIDVHRVDYSY